MSFGTIMCLIFAGITGIIVISFTIYLCSKKKFDAVVSGQIIDSCYNPGEFNHEDTWKGADPRFDIDGVRVYTTSAYPIFSYTVNGKEYTRAEYIYISRSSINRKKKRGVKVYYKASQPEIATIFNGGILRLVRNILLIITVVLLCVGLIVH
ncbi:MAG: hypothetical protein K2J90_09390 [Lachnospiraceae bacterium]|nr:hypothetical protein [Lachnospiraceae bacterium]